MLDSRAQRETMIFSQLRTNDVKQPRVLAAMQAVPRERFVPEAQISTAYMESCVSLENGRKLIDPRSIGKLLQLADIGPEDSVLDVGCASGYSTAVLAQMAQRVVALESDSALAAAAARILAALNVSNARIVEGPLPEGYSADALYDVIFVGGAVTARPERLLQQLKDGGRLVVILKTNAAAHARLYLNHAGIVSDRYAFDADLPVLPGFEKIKSFVF